MIRWEFGGQMAIFYVNNKECVYGFVKSMMILKNLVDGII
jgi:hypothetical protein